MPEWKKATRDVARYEFLRRIVMAIESIVSLRGFTKIALALFFSVCMCQGSAGQGTSPVVATGPISAVADHPATWGQVWETAISSKGDLVVYDFEQGALYEFPAGGAPLITLAAPGLAGPGGGWANMGVAIDPWDNLWIGQNWNAELIRIPYDAVNETWNLSDPAAITYQYPWGGGNQAFATALGGGWFQAAAFTFGPKDAGGMATMVISAENSGTLYSVSVDDAGNISNGVTIMSGMTARAKSLAIDPIGNIYLYEDGGVSGIVEVPAGATGLANDKSLTRVDPNLGNPTGVAVDVNGNVYVSDSKAGVYFVPNEDGTPNPSHAVLMVAVPAYANIDFDLVRGIVYVPTTPGEKGGWAVSTTVVYNDVVAVAFSNLVFGSGAAYVPSAGQSIDFGFAASETPATIEIVNGGAESTDFAIISGGTCSVGTTYAAGTSCTVNVAMISHNLGNVSAKLEMRDANGNLLASVSLSGIGVVPALVAGPPAAMQTHPATWGQVWESAVSSKGDLVIHDFEHAALYQFPAGGGPMITIAAPGTSGPGGGWANLGVAIDPWDNLWVGQNWNSELIRVPYDPVNKTWNMADPGAIVYQYPWGGGNQAFATALAGGWFQAAAFAFGPLNAGGTATMVISAENSGALYSVSIDALGNVTNGATVIASMKARAKTLAIDHAGNIYLFEDGGATGVLRIPAGTINRANDTGLARVDPGLANPGGVAVDAAGNVYVGDNKKGVYLVPLENAIPNPVDAILLTGAPAFANVDFDIPRGVMYVPTTNGESGGFNGINDIASVALSNVNLGSAAAGMQGTPSAVSFGFSAGVNPDSITILEAGSKTPDFTIASGGTCATGTAMAALSACSVNVALSPNAAGGVSGKLIMLDAQKNVLGSMTLYGFGQAPDISITPALEGPVGANLNTPGQVAADAAGNSYVADAGLHEILMYPAGAGASTPPATVGTGLAAPTGVAVDGAGDVFIADSGNVFEVPNIPGGLSASGQMTLKTGLGTRLNLAADGLGNLYIADPDHAQVVKLGNPGGKFGATTQIETDLTGFTAPSLVAVDAGNNLYVVDSPKLIEVPADGTQTTLLPSLGAATGLAIDPSGAVYAGMSGGAVRIPFVSGALDQGSEATLAATVTNPTGLALDKANNVYLADGTAQNLHLVSIDGAVNTGSPVLGASGTATATLMNIGNSPLTVTGFSSSDTADFSATGCGSAVAPAGTCVATITMDPEGPGVQGPISSVITVQSNAAFSPVVVDASGVAAALAVSTPTISLGSGANVFSTPITVSVVSASGTGVTPTGNVVISVDGVAQPPAALVNGTVTIAIPSIIAGSHTFSVKYIGDRVYGSSTASTPGIVAKASPLVAVPDLPNPTYVLFIGNQTGKYIPYDGSLNSYLTNYTVLVQGAPGLVPTGTLSFMQGTTAKCGPNQATNNGVPTGLTPGSYTLDVTGAATLPLGCLEITTTTNVPNEVTPQTISSIVYGGDANYAPMTLTTTAGGGSISFLELRQPSVAITPNPASVTVPAAAYPSTGTASTTLTVTSVLGYGVSTNPAYPSSTPTLTLNNYTLPLGFNCQNLPPHTTCTFSGGNYTDINGVLHPDEVLVDTDPAKPVTITVTVTTNVSAGTTTSQNAHPSPFEYAAMFGLGLVGLAFSRKSVHRKGVLVLICLLALGTAMAGLTACNTVTLGSAPVLGTPTSTSPNAVSVVAQQVGSEMVPSSQGPIILYGNTNQMSLPFTLNVVVQ